MTGILLPEELEAIGKRAAAATKGPWVAETDDGMASRPECVWMVNYKVATVHGYDASVHNTADFIAHARTDVPALLHHAEAMAARVRELEGALIIIRDNSQDEWSSRYAGGIFSGDHLKPIQPQDNE